MVIEEPTAQLVINETTQKRKHTVLEDTKEINQEEPRVKRLDKNTDKIAEAILNVSEKEMLEDSDDEKTEEEIILLYTECGT